MPNKENLIPAKKGEVRNPNGRPAGSLNKSTIVKMVMDAEENFKNPISGKYEYLSQAIISTFAILREARSGNVHAYRTLMDAAYGKDPDTYKVDHTTNGEKIESVIVHYVKPKD
jgi:hypothetical protein